MKESLWLLLYTNLSLHEAIKMLHWLEPLDKSGELPFISSQAWKIQTWIRGFICKDKFMLVLKIDNVWVNLICWLTSGRDRGWCLQGDYSPQRVGNRVWGRSQRTAFSLPTYTVAIFPAVDWCPAKARSLWHPKAPTRPVATSLDITQMTRTPPCTPARRQNF